MRARNLPAMRHALFLAFLLPTFVSGQAQYDARILSYEGLGQVCDGMVQPRLKIMNQGSQVMSTCVVETWKNGFMNNSFNWELAVGAVQDEVRQPTFPPVEVVEGDVLEFRIISVNMVADEVADGNVLDVTITDDATELSTATVMLDLGSGAQCGPLSWSMNDATGALVQSGDVPLGATNEVWMTLSTNACYEFRVRLTDGGDIGDCLVRLYCEGELVHEVTSVSEGERRVGLHTGAVVGMNEPVIAGPVLFPVPAHDRSTVTGIVGNGPVRTMIVDATGRIVRNGTGVPGGGQLHIDVQGLAPGHYLLHLVSGGRSLRPMPFVVE